jgi:Holliday junction resolvasome RuvABC endonuclease subunit
MVIVALDLGTTTGFAVHSKHGITSGTLNFKKKGKFHDSAFKALYDFLCTFTEGGVPVEIAVEKPHAGRFIAPVRILFGLLAVVHLFSDEFGIILTEYSPKEIKKFATGSGNAKKPEMVAAVQKEFPNITNDNQADAVQLLRLHLSKGQV